MKVRGFGVSCRVRLLDSLNSELGLFLLFLESLYVLVWRPLIVLIETHTIIGLCGIASNDFANKFLSIFKNLGVSIRAIYLHGVGDIMMLCC